LNLKTGKKKLEIQKGLKESRQWTMGFSGGEKAEE